MTEEYTQEEIDEEMIQVKSIADEILNTYLDEEGENTHKLALATILVAYCLGRMGGRPHEEMLLFFSEVTEGYEPFADLLVKDIDEAENSGLDGDNVIIFPDKETLH